MGRSRTKSNESPGDDREPRYFIVPHPVRHIEYVCQYVVAKYGVRKVYCDDFSGNQDPYVWRNRFLHSYCKMNRIPCSKLQQGDYLLWISPVDKSQIEKRWLCDLVFEVDRVRPWDPKEGKIGREGANNRIQDTQLWGKLLSDEDSYEYHDHFKWVDCRAPGVAKAQHVFGGRKIRRTLVATEKSYQPQCGDGSLVDVTKLVSKFYGNRQLKWKPVKELNECQGKGFLDFICDQVKATGGKRVKGPTLRSIYQECRIYDKCKAKNAGAKSKG